METQPLNEKSPQEHFELRMRTLRILWFSMLMSVVIYYVITLFVGPSEVESNDMLSLILAAVALMTVLVSFFVKSKLITRAVEQQRVQLVQQAYIVAWAVTEVAALLGLLDFFATGHRHYYILFIIAAIGQLLHFPRREHVTNASSLIKVS